MEETIKPLMEKECYSIISTLQISNADLPNAFEKALSDTNLMQQNVRTVKQK